MNSILYIGFFDKFIYLSVFCFGVLKFNNLYLGKVKFYVINGNDIYSKLFWNFCF